MSAELLDHVRYPTDLFKVQRSILGTYHVTNANSFYSGDDAWNTPQEPTSGTNDSSDTADTSTTTNSGTNALGATTTTSRANLQDPYYLTMKVPGQGTAYTLYTTYIPQQSAGSNNRNVLTGYLAVDSDAGGAGKGKKASGYGKLTLLTMPKTDNIPGPAQVQNLFNSDTTVSQELNILKRGNSTVKQGNLLTLPVGGGFLYVQPVYVQSTSSGSYPLLQKVLVAFGDKIAFEDTLDEALNSLFGGDSGAAAGDQGAAGGSSGSSGSDSGSSSGSDSGSSSGSDSGSSAGSGSSSDSGTDNAALQKALNDAKQALQDRQDAYADNDLVAAAEADQRLQEAIQAATEAESGN